MSKFRTVNANLTNFASLVLCALLLSAPVGAQTYPQTYPSRPLHLVTQFAPGSTGDTLCRLIAPGITEIFGQPVIVDNRAGAGGVLAAEAVARAAPDGYSFLVGTTGTQIMRIFLARKSSFDPVKDFTPITEIGETTTLWVAAPNFAPNSFREMIEYARQNPGKVAYGTSGIGSPHHLSGELVKQLAGVDMLHIPYKASAQALQDTIAGQIPTTFAISGLVVPAVKSGKIKALAIVRDHRFKALPDVPSVGEVVAGFETPPSWTGMFGPAGFNTVLLKRIHADMVKALNLPQTREKLLAQTFEVITSESTDAFAAQIQRQIALVGKIIKGAGIQPIE